MECLKAAGTRRAPIDLWTKPSLLKRLTGRETRLGDGDLGLRLALPLTPLFIQQLSVDDLPLPGEVWSVV